MKSDMYLLGLLGGAITYAVLPNRLGVEWKVVLEVVGAIVMIYSTYSLVYAWINPKVKSTKAYKDTHAVLTRDSNPEEYVAYNLHKDPTFATRQAKLARGIESIKKTKFENPHDKEKDRQAYDQFEVLAKIEKKKLEDEWARSQGMKRRMLLAESRKKKKAPKKRKPKRK